MKKSQLNVLCLSIIIFGPAILYLTTLAPTITWEESATWIAFVGENKVDFFGQTGHGLHTLCGILFSWLSPDLPYTQNLMSAFFACLSLIVLYLLLIKLTDSPLAGFIGAISLSVSQTFWHLAVITESYSMLTFFMLLQIYFLLRLKESQRFYFFILLCLSLAGGFLTHRITLLFAPIFIGFAYAWVKRQKPMVLSIAIIEIAIILFWFFSPASQNMMTVLTAPGQLKLVNYLSFSQLPQELILYPVYLFYQFPFLGLWLGILGVLECWKRDKSLCVLLISVLATDVIFSSCYYLRRSPYCLLLSYIPFAIMIGKGFRIMEERLITRMKHLILAVILMIILPILTYHIIPRLADTSQINLTPSARRIPVGRSNIYYLTPDKRNHRESYRFAGNIINTLPDERAILMGEISGIGPISYCLTSERPSLEIQLIIPDWFFNRSKPSIWANIRLLINHNLKMGRKVYLVKSNTFVTLTDKKEYFNVLPLITQYYNLIPQGEYLWKVTHY